jgi:hypothetical protein
MGLMTAVSKRVCVTEMGLMTAVSKCVGVTEMGLMTAVSGWRLLKGG